MSLDVKPWKVVPFGRAVRDATGGQPKVQRQHYLPKGALPVIDQGDDSVGGFTDNLAMSYSGSLPVVLFGDHTRVFKYVESPFALGADGVKVLAPIKSLTAKFLYYYLQSVTIPSRGYSRHFKFLREITIPLPPLSEQRRIVEILDQADAVRQKLAEADAKVSRILETLLHRAFSGDLTAQWREGHMKDLLAEMEQHTKAVATATPGTQGKLL